MIPRLFHYFSSVSEESALYPKHYVTNTETDEVSLHFGFGQLLGSVQNHTRSVRFGTAREYFTPLCEIHNLRVCLECPSLSFSPSIIYNPDGAHFTDLKCAFEDKKKNVSLF